jgi:hypothetical protein
MKRAAAYLLLIPTHITLCIWAFTQHFKHPLNTVFCTWGDGIKNYFTLQSFVSHPIDKGGVFKFNQFAYPYGDFVFYTDNTPLFSVPFRWFCSYVVDISSYAIPTFNFFIILNIIICGLVVFWVFEKLLNSKSISFLFAVILPWIHPQVLRIFFGHFNLSLASLSVLAIALFILWYQCRSKPTKQIFVSILIVLFSVSTFLCHGYYIAIITAFSTAMMFYYSIFICKNQGGKLSFLLSLLVPIVILSIVLFLLYRYDAYLPLRKETAMGYDYDGQKTQLHTFFTHYPFHQVFFPLHMGNVEDNFEQNAYLGNIGLLCFSYIIIACFISSNFRSKIIVIQKDFFADPARKSIVLAGLTLLLISFGEHYSLSPIDTKITLPFNVSDTLDVYHAIIYFSFAALFIVFTFLFYKKQGSFLQIEKKNLIKIILLASLLIIAISVLTTTITFNITNILNPFYYLHFLTNRVEQFRYLSRFNWPFYWVFYTWLAYTIVKMYQQQGKTTRIYFWFILLFLGSVELTDNILNLRKRANKPNPFAAKELNSYKSTKINYRNYQAILPIPFYMVGSENYDYTIDDEDDHSTFTMQLSLFSKLPLMSCKMSRTPPEYSKQFLNFVANDIVDNDLRAKLNNKPILVVLNKKLASDTNAAYIPEAANKVAHALCIKTLNFVDRHHLKAIDSIGALTFYSYQLP